MRNRIFTLALIGSLWLAPLFSRAAAPQDVISFSQAWDQILDRSLRTQAQSLTVDINRQQKLSRWGAFTPTLTLQAAESRAGVPSTGPLYSAEAVSTWNLFRSGSDMAGLDAADRELKSSQERLGVERQATEEEAAQGLIDVIAKEKSRQIVEKIVRLKEESVRVARERYQRGLLPLQEVDKTGIDLENSRARLIDAETSLANARAELEALLGFSNIQIEWPWRQMLLKGTNILERDFQLGQRPDWKAAQYTVEAAGLRKRQAVGLLFPSLDFKASYGYRDLADINVDRRNWATSLVLTIPLFEGFANYTNYRIEDDQWLISQVNAEKVRRFAEPEVEALRRNFKSARESALAREKTAELTQKLFADNFQRFRLGRASVNDLAIDQNRLFESELLSVEGWASAHVSYVRLCHALGGYVRADGACQQERPSL